jgi:hypothetical protein
MTLACFIALQLSGTPGFADPQVRAVLTVIEEESRFEPCVISRDGLHEGLFQLRGGRRDDLHRSSGVVGCVSAEKQVLFMTREFARLPGYHLFLQARTCSQAKSVFVRYYEVRSDRKPGCR